MPVKWREGRLENNVPFESLLIVDPAPEHRPFTGYLFPNVTVDILLRATTSLR